MNVRVVIAGVVAVLLTAGPALAQPGRTPVGPPQAYAPPAAPAATYTKRYGSSIALADAASVAAVLVGGVIVLSAVLTSDCIESECSDNDDSGGLGVVLMIGGMAGYAFGGPLIHTAHGNGSGAGKSLALRLGLPLAGALVGAAMAGDCGDCGGEDDLSGQLGALGVASAMVIDWALLAKKEVRIDAPVMPYAGPTRGGGMTLGLGGTF